MGVAAQNRVVQLAQEGHGFQIFLAAVLVGLPLALLAVVVQIQHGGHGIHAQTVDVVLLQPVQSAGDQEALHLAAAEVEHHGAPLLVLAALGVRVLIAGLPVKVVQAELVLGEVGGHPVHDDADAGFMELIHKGHEVLGGAVAAGGGEIARDLIAPASIEGVLHDGQQLHVGVAHLLDVRDELVGQLGIVVGDLLALGLPAARVHLVDIHRPVDDIGLLLGLLPCFVVPRKAAQVVDFAAVGRAGLSVERIGVGLVDKVARTGRHAVFVNVIFLHAGDEQLPHRVVVHLAHRVAARFPAVEISHHADGGGMGCPDAEHHAGLSGASLNMRTEVTVCFAVISLLEQINRQIRRVRVDFFFRRFHKQLLPVQAAEGPIPFYSLILKNFRAIFKAFSRKCTIIFSLIFFRYIQHIQFYANFIGKPDRI